MSRIASKTINTTPNTKLSKLRNVVVTMNEIVTSCSEDDSEGRRALFVMEPGPVGNTISGSDKEIGHTQKEVEKDRMYKVM